VLGKHLAEGAVPAARTFFADVARQIASPWDISAGGDLGHPAVEGKRTLKIRMANAYVARLHRAAVHDPALTNAFIRVAGLIDQPPALMKPGNLIRVLRHGKRVPSVTQPATLPTGQDSSTQDKAA